MTTVEEALASIPARRDSLDVTDSRISKVIQHVEYTLAQLRPGVPTEVYYSTSDGRYILRHGKHDGQWKLFWGTEENDDTKDVALLRATRLARAEVFTVDDGGLAPIERLIIAVADNLVVVAQDRSPQVETAERLAAALERAGFHARDLE